MSIGRTITDVDAVSTMQSFFPGNSLYVFVEGEQLKDADGSPVMLRLDVAAHLMGNLARLCFADIESATKFLEPYMDFQKEQDKAIQDILDSVPVNPPPTSPDEDG